MTNKQLRVFLCYGKGDQKHVQSLHRRLRNDGVDCWLDEEKLLAGQNWRKEIPKAIQNSDVVIVCLTKKTVSKEGYVQKEIKLALEAADERPEGSIYLIPAKFEECSMPDDLKDKQWVNLFETKGYDKLVSALHLRAKELKRTTLEKKTAENSAGGIREGLETENLRDLKFSNVSPPIMFVNRDDEIDAVMATASSGGQYFLIDAPTGYGKTWLLNKLDEQFKSKKHWLHAFVSIKKDSSLEALTKKLAEKLGVTLSSDTSLDWGYRLSGALKKRCEDSSAPAGIALLIDLDEEPSIPLAKQLFEGFIPQLWENLSELDAFSRSANPSLLRVILSGRNIATEKSIKNFRDQLPFINKILSPFTYDVVYKSARNYLPDLEKKKLDQLVAHLMFVTGGHPGCMSSVLHLYKTKNIPIEKFVTDTREVLWGQIVRNVTEKVWDGVRNRDKRAQEAIYRLSVYRYVNNHVLRHIMDRCPVKGMRDEIDLRDMLTASYLYTGDGRFLQDGIIRQLVLIHLRQTDSKLYEDYCKDAYHVCKEQLLSPSVQLPEKWIVEMLNQYLLRHARNDIDYPAFRSKISKEFNKEVASIMQIRKKTKKSVADWREEADVLLSEMDNETQWEFRFSVNYFLRDGQYTDIPFQRLKSEIKKHSK